MLWLRCLGGGQSVWEITSPPLAAWMQPVAWDMGGNSHKETVPAWNKKYLLNLLHCPFPLSLLHMLHIHTNGKPDKTNQSYVCLKAEPRFHIKSHDTTLYSQFLQNFSRSLTSFEHSLLFFFFLRLPFAAEHPCLKQERAVGTYNKESFTIFPFKKKYKSQTQDP